MSAATALRAPGAAMAALIGAVMDELGLGPADPVVDLLDRLARPTATHARSADGRRLGTLTAAGIPFEVSLTGTDGPDPVVRVTVEPGSAFPFFGPRCRALTDAVGLLAHKLPQASPQTRQLLTALVPAAYPEPQRVDAHARLVGCAGFGWARTGLASGRAYVHLRPGTGASGGLDDLLGTAPGLSAPPPAWMPHAVAVQVDGADVVRKAYFRSRRAIDVAALTASAEGESAGAGEIVAAVERVLRTSRVPARSCVLARSARSTEESWCSTLYWQVGGRPQDLAAVAVARDIEAALHGRASIVDTLVRAGARAGVPWTCTMVGVGLTAPGDVPKVNVYACPTVAAEAHQ